MAALALAVVASLAAAVALPEPWCLVGLLLGIPLVWVERRWRREVQSFVPSELDTIRDRPATPGAWFDWRARHALRTGRDWDSLSWLSLRAVAASLNQLTVTAPMIHELRARWDERLAADTDDAADPQARLRIVDMTSSSSFVVVGDTGEQDKSQYAVAPALVSESGQVDFLVISSDVVYPAGGVNDYVDALFRPYEGFERRIFGLPGNHDWYDGLRGFMFHFCGQTGQPPSRIDRASALRFLLSLTWRWRAKPDRELLDRWRAKLPSFAPGAPPQPGSYYAIDLGSLLLVCIDTGIKGDLDARQGRWLEEVSALPQDKLLITGRPLVVNQTQAACPIAWPRGEQHAWGSVGELVQAPEHRYVACVGGDIHNHQTYRWTDGRRPGVHLVSGGGGAFTSATHAIPPTPGPVEGAAPALPALVDTFPAQPASLVIYARRFVPRLWQLMLGLLAAWIGVGASTAALLVLDPGLASGDRAGFERTAEQLLVAGAVAVGAWGALLQLGLGSRGREAIAPWRRTLSRLVAFVLGGVLAATAWWLVGDGFAWVVGGFAAAALLAAAWARLLRSGAIAVLGRRPKLETAITAGLALLAAGLGIWRLVDGSAVAAAHPAWLVLLLGAMVVVPPVFIDVAQVNFRTKYQYVLVGAAVLLAGGLVALDGSASASAWIPEAVAGITAVLATVALAVLSAYAVFFGGLGLLFRPGARTGEFEPGDPPDDDIAATMLRWQQGRRAGLPHDQLPATTRRNRQITHIAMLGKGAPRSPVLDKTSEIFDSDESPFQKSYLRFRVQPGSSASTLVIEAVTVTGEERSRDELGSLWAEPLAIPLGPPGAGTSFDPADLGG